MTSSTSIDPSIDELLLLEENQSHMSNFLVNKIKPIGAERKIGQSMMTLPGIDFTNQNFNSLHIASSSTRSTLTSLYDHSDFSSLDQLHCSTYPSFSNYSSCSILPSAQSVSHSLDNCIYQRQISTSPAVVHQHQPISNTGKIRAAFCATQTSSINRFSAPQQYARNSFLNISQRNPPSFSVPSQSTRERFQVNSIGRPILRSNAYHHYLKIRR